MSEESHHRARVFEVLATWRRDIRIATGFLTRVPLRWEPEATPRPLSDVARAFPLVGAGVGLVSGLVLAAAQFLDLPQYAGALLALAAAMATTGGLHEDGLADTVDGFGGGVTREDKLRIMRDSGIGAFGVAALVIVIGLKASAIATFHSPGAALAALVGAGAVSRAAMPIFMNALDPARTDGLGHSAGRPQAGDAWAAAAIGAFFALFVGIRSWLAGLIACVIVGYLLIRLARRQIGGYTGDVCGMVQMVTETVFLLVAATTEL